MASNTALALSALPSKSVQLRDASRKYARMGYQELHAHIQHLLVEAPTIVSWFNEGERRCLLPALQAMKKLVTQQGRRTPGELPTWFEECALLGIKPATVRKWKSRTGTEFDIREILGEKLRPRKKKLKPLDRTSKALVILAHAVLDRDERYMTQLALAIVDEFEV